MKNYMLWLRGGQEEPWTGQAESLAEAIATAEQETGGIVVVGKEI